MSFASISCCRGPTKADIESAWRPGATAERIGSRGIRPRQELATASMFPVVSASGEALPADVGRRSPRLSSGQRAQAVAHFLRSRTVRVFTPRCHLSAYFCKPRRLPRFRCPIPRSTPPSGANPSRRSPPFPTPLPNLPRVSLASRHQFFLPAHTSGRHVRLIVMHAITCWVR